MGSGEAPPAVDVGADGDDMEILLQVIIVCTVAALGAFYLRKLFDLTNAPEVLRVTAWVVFGLVCLLVIAGVFGNGPVRVGRLW